MTTLNQFSAQFCQMCTHHPLCTHVGVSDEGGAIFFGQIRRFTFFFARAGNFCHDDGFGRKIRMKYCSPFARIKRKKMIVGRSLTRRPFSNLKDAKFSFGECSRYGCFSPRYNGKSPFHGFKWPRNRIR